MFECDFVDPKLTFIPPKLPDLPDPALSSSKWNQVNGPFGGTVTSLFKTVDGYWATTTDNSGFADSNLYFIDKETFTWELKKTIGGNMAGVVVGKHNPDGVAFITEHQTHRTQNYLYHSTKASHGQKRIP